MIVESVAQTIIGAHTSSYSHMLDAGLLDSHAEFLHQNINDGKLYAGSQIVLVLLNKIRISSHPFAQAVEETGLEARETVVQTRNMRLRETECLRIALACILIYDRTTRISPLQNLGALVNSLSSRIVDGLSQHFHIVVGIHLYNLRISTAHEKTDEREWRCTLVIIAFLDEMSHHMTLQMVYIYHRDIERTGESLGKTYTHKERAHQTRTTGEGYGRKIFLLDAGTRDGLVNDRNHILLVGTGSQLRNNTAISFVNLLRGGYIAQQHTILEHCSRGIVAAALYT